MYNVYYIFTAAYIFKYKSFIYFFYILYTIFFRLVTTIIHEVRPAGMGLGADKIALQKQGGKVKKGEEEELKIVKGSFIKIIAGKRSNTYGQIEGFDDAGRLIVKMTLNGNTISVNECIVQAVTKAEYLKNSKVLS